MLVPALVNFSIAVSGFISVTEMLNAIVVLVVEELDGAADEISEALFFAAISQGNLFTKKRLVIFKNVFAKNEALMELFEKNAGALKDSGDIFVFWEATPLARRSLGEGGEKEISALFEKYSEH